MTPTDPFVERETGWLSDSYVLRDAAGDELARYESQRAAEDALREELRPREGGGLLSWLF